MHECPECGQACDCDGEDVWFDDDKTIENCIHECDPADALDFFEDDVDEAD